MEIKFIPTHDLIEELISRFDMAVFGGQKTLSAPGRGKDATDIETWRRWKGNSHMCMGLSLHMANMISSDFEDKEKPIKTESGK
jgi:hypothetical protein